MIGSIAARIIDVVLQKLWCSLIEPVDEGLRVIEPLDEGLRVILQSLGFMEL